MTSQLTPAVAVDLGLSLRGVVKTFGTLRAVDGLDLDVRTGTCLGLLGATSWAELTPAHLAAAPPVAAPDTFSAFPLLP